MNLFKGFTLLTSICLIYFPIGCTQKDITKIENIKDSPGKDLVRETSVFPIEVGTIDRSSPNSYKGCGTYFWETTTNPNKDGILLSSPISDPAIDPTVMVFNGKISKLKIINRIERFDEAEYATTETYVTEDDAISVQVDFTVGELLGYEARRISKGVITITTQEKTKKINVTGITGC